MHYTGIMCLPLCFSDHLLFSQDHTLKKPTPMPPNKTTHPQCKKEM